MKYADTEYTFRAGQRSHHTRRSECILVLHELIDNDSHFLGCVKSITQSKLNTIIIVRLTASNSLYFLKIKRSFVATTSFRSLIGLLGRPSLSRSSISASQARTMASVEGLADRLQPCHALEETLSTSQGIPVAEKRPKLHGRAFYESIGAPKMILAPMVDQSEYVRLLFSVRCALHYTY